MDHWNILCNTAYKQRDFLLTVASGGLNPHILQTTDLHCVQVLWLGESLDLRLSSVFLQTGHRDFTPGSDLPATVEEDPAALAPGLLGPCCGDPPLPTPCCKTPPLPPPCCTGPPRPVPCG